MDESPSLDASSEVSPDVPVGRESAPPLLVSELPLVTTKDVRLRLRLRPAPAATLTSLSPLLVVVVAAVGYGSNSESSLSPSPLSLDTNAVVGLARRVRRGGDRSMPSAPDAVAPPSDGRAVAVPVATWRATGCVAARWGGGLAAVGTFSGAELECRSGVPATTKHQSDSPDMALTAPLRVLAGEPGSGEPPTRAAHAGLRDGVARALGAGGRGGVPVIALSRTAIVHGCSWRRSGGSTRAMATVRTAQ